MYSTTDYVLTSHQKVLEQRTNLVSNNIANSSSFGFKELLPLTHSAHLHDGGYYAETAGTYINIGTGAITKTNNDLDVAITGSGFLQIEGENGKTLYSRNGHFTLDEEGMLRNSSRMPVLNTYKEKIYIPNNAKSIHITKDGTLYANNIAVTKLGIFSITEPYKMEAHGHGLYSTTETPTPDTKSSVLQGYIETSNVEATDMLTQMIRAQRLYEGDSNLLSSERDIFKQYITTYSSK